MYNKRLGARITKKLNDCFVKAEWCKQSLKVFEGGVVVERTCAQLESWRIRAGVVGHVVDLYVVLGVRVHVMRCSWETWSGLLSVIVSVGGCVGDMDCGASGAMTGMNLSAGVDVTQDPFKSSVNQNRYQSRLKKDIRVTFTVRD